MDQVYGAPLSEIDPLVHRFTAENDARFRDPKKIVPATEHGTSSDPTAAALEDVDPSHPLFPYEALPRSGLQHPFCKMILKLWLGTELDPEKTEAALETLRTWWQHRRKGETRSAVAALKPPKFQTILDGYTLRFFNVALSLVVNDGEQGPRTLFKKIDSLKKPKNRMVKERLRRDHENRLEKERRSLQTMNLSTLSPLEKLHLEQLAIYFKSDSNEQDT